MPSKVLGSLLLVVASCGAPAASAVNCTMSVPAMTFPSYAVTSASNTSVNIVLTCTKQTGDTTVPYVINMTAGSASFTRQMDDNTTATQLLDYNVYTNGTHTTIWGDATAGTSAPTGTFDFTALAVGAQLQATHTAYGLIPANQDLNPDGYAPTTPPINVRARKTAGGGPPNLTGNVALAVSMTLPAFCAIDSAGNLGFGTYTPSSGTPLDVSSIIQMRCTKTTPYTIALSAGGAGGFSPRKMTNTGPYADQLNYNLYTTNAYAAIWGDGTGGTSTVAGAGAGLLAAAAINSSVFGRLFTGQDMAAGTYSDTITVTVSY